MSIVLYHDNQLVSESICIFGQERLKSRKIFPYCRKELRTIPNGSALPQYYYETGYLGFTGNLNAAQACLHALMTSGQTGFWEMSKDVCDDDRGFTCIIIPVEGNFIWQCGHREPLGLMHKQTRIIGFDDGIPRVKCLLEQGMSAVAALEKMVIAAKTYDTEVYAQGPIMRFHTSTMFSPTVEERNDPILMQFWDEQAEAEILKTSV